MTTRMWKYVVLAAAGGMILQMAGCGQMLVETLVSNVLPTVVTGLVGAITSGAS